MIYKTGIIYFIICILNPSIIYIGSTLNTIDKRMTKHSQQYKYFTEGKYHNYSIYEYFTKYNIENFKIIPIKTYQVVDENHIHAYEQLWINKYQKFKNLKVINIQSAFNPLYLIRRKRNITCAICKKVIKFDNYIRHLQSSNCINYNQ